MFKVPEKHRMTNHPNPKMNSDASFGNNGVFKIPYTDEGTGECVVLWIIASDGAGWEHVSLHTETVAGETVTPTWDEMCFVKDTFWQEEDCVVQFHPPKSEYVNMHPHVLHLWRPAGRNIDTPPSILVGLKK